MIESRADHRRRLLIMMIWSLATVAMFTAAAMADLQGWFL